MSRWLFVPAIMLIAACEPADVKGKCRTGEPHVYAAPYNMVSCPADIQAWMDRANMCAHFMGEEAYDEERRAFLNAQMDDLGCAMLGCDYTALFGRYEGDLVYTGILTGYAETAFGAVDHLPVCPQDGP